MNNTLNLNLNFNNRLREIPESIDDIKEFIQYESNRVSTTKNFKSLKKIYGSLGVYSRIINDLENSEIYLKKAIDLSNYTNDPLRVFINKIRLGNTYQWQEDFHASNLIFDSLFDQLQNPIFLPYEDFLYQHYGKNLFDQGLYTKALEYFKLALELRIIKNNSELIDSTLFAINICNTYIEL